MNTHTKTLFSAILGFSLFAFSASAIAHGDVAPQPVDTKGLEELGEEWREVNPYRGNGKAVEIGKSAYNQNCARCHGLGAVSGGIAPDLRAMPWGDEGDVFYVQRVKNGAIRNGITYMPAFDGVVSQEGLWTIRAWLDTVSDHIPDDFLVDGKPVDKEAIAAAAAKEQEKAKAAEASAGPRTGKDIVKKTCASCHTLGIANAPKIDMTGRQKWQERYANGLESMIEAVKKGKNAMPPMAGDPTLSDKEIKEAIIYMMGLAGLQVASKE